MNSLNWKFVNFLFIFECSKNDDTAKEIIESRREVHKFDDYAFQRTDLKKIRIRVNQVKNLK